MEKMRQGPRKLAERREFIKTGEGVENYSVEGDAIELEWKEFAPNGEAATPDSLIFLPGWSAGSAKTLEDLTAKMAENVGSRGLQIQTRSEAVESDLMNEARTIRDSIVRRGITGITLAAYSEGGVKAVDLIDILQKENPEISIRGLILLDPVGLYEQDPRELVGAFAKDSLINTPKTMVSNAFSDKPFADKMRTIKHGIGAGSDVIFNTVREALRSGTDYPEKLRSQIAEMGAENEHYRDVRCPVVLIQGADDPVSSHGRVLPEDPGTLSARSDLLREAIFPNSPRVDMLIPKKFGHHGLPHFRSEQVAKVSTYLLERYERRGKTASETPTA